MDNKLESYITKLLLFCYLIKNLSNYIFDNKYIKSDIYLEGKRKTTVPLSLFPLKKDENQRQVKENVIRNAWNMGQNN